MQMEKARMDLTKEQQPIIFDERLTSRAHHRPERKEQSLEWGPGPKPPDLARFCRVPG